MLPEEIKKTWEEASRKMYRPTPAEFENMYREKKETALTNLAKRYKRFSTVGLAMILCAFGWLCAQNPIIPNRMRYIVVPVLMLYFATCSIWDWWLYKGVSSIDCFTMSVSEVIDKALYYRKKHLQSMMLLVPFAIIVVGLMAYSFINDRYILIGMCTGGLIGLLVGYRAFREFMDEYRTVTKQ